MESPCGSFFFFYFLLGVVSLLLSPIFCLPSPSPFPSFLLPFPSIFSLAFLCEVRILPLMTVLLTCCSAVHQISREACCSHIKSSCAALECTYPLCVCLYYIKQWLHWSQNRFLFPSCSTTDEIYSCFLGENKLYPCKCTKHNLFCYLILPLVLKYNDFPNIIFFFYSSQNTLLDAIDTEVNKIIPKGVYIVMERDISNLDFIIIENC